MVGSLIFSCNSPKRQKKVNDGKLFEKLKEKKGYLNALELKRLKQDFSLKLLAKYDLSGYDEEDTLAYFVRSGSSLWIASCYLGEDDDISNPFFCLKETKEKGFTMIHHGTIPLLMGDCSYDLDKLLIQAGNYILVSQKSYGSGYCDDSPLVFTADGKPIRKGDNQFRIITRNCSEEFESTICFERNFKFELDKSKHLLVRIREKEIDWEIEQEVGSKNYDLSFIIKNNTIHFQDTLYK